MIAHCLKNHNNNLNTTKITYSHDDIKEAMLSLVHMVRLNTDKLERHEARDKQHSEHMKKAVALITKRLTAVDELKGYLLKLDERITGLEQVIEQV